MSGNPDVYISNSDAVSTVDGWNWLGTHYLFHSSSSLFQRFSRSQPDASFGAVTALGSETLELSPSQPDYLGVLSTGWSLSHRLS